MLRGERVTLRAVERDDMKRLHELYGNVDLALLGFGAWQPRPMAEFEKFFERQMADNADPLFAIEADGKLVGDCQLQMRDRRSQVSSLGIAIYDPDYVGKGYGREALALLVDWAFRVQNYQRLWLGVFSNNERAIRCYRAVGFVEEGRQRRQMYVGGEYVDNILMGLLREEWS